ncbi:Adaptor complexes medium subunit family [Musa troglodytarum]|uniref:Adaptor complexes medium subunit family n=1 Tax=Musa troglodytarum TaxID=320322 RepID=A0A9E7K8X4_9LILI|nr:Adaptor complexes medium subunit family [Musa troglodytarum]
MISQFFVLSQRGDNIVFRDYRGEVPKGSAEIFFRKVKFWKEDEEEEAPPVFNVDGVNYIHVKVAGLFFVATTRVNISPSLVLELLQRIARVIKDYLGVLNEDSLRKNFVLVYELLDEVIDFGYPQTTSTEVLKSYIFNEPIEVDVARLPPLGPASMFMQGTKRMPGTAVTKSVVSTEPGGRKREEIFVDIIEKISVTFSSSGYILTSEIDGTIQMKSYLTGNPEIRLALNEDLTIGRGSASVYDYRSSSGGAVILDDCNFHESVRLDSFDADRTLTLIPSDGEFAVMNYRMTQEFKPPFRVNALIEEAGQLKIVGGSEHTLRAKLTFSQESHGNIAREAGPVNMNFTIPMYNASKLQVRYLQIAKKSPSYNPYRVAMAGRVTTGPSPLPTASEKQEVERERERGIRIQEGLLGGGRRKKRERRTAYGRPMARRRQRAIPPCSKTYGFPIYCAAWVPIDRISAAAAAEAEAAGKKKEGGGEAAAVEETAEKKEQGGGEVAVAEEEAAEKKEQEGGQSFHTLDPNRPLVALGGGGGEGRSGVPNVLLIAEFDLISRSLSDTPVFRLGTDADVPYRMAVHPGGDGVVCAFPKSCRWFDWDIPESKKTYKLALKSSAKILTPLEDVGLQLALAFDAEGSILATGGEDGHLRVFKWPSMENILDQTDAHSTVKDLDFSSNGKFLVSLGNSGPCRVWDLTSSTAIASLPRENGEIFGFCRFSRTRADNPILYVTAMHGNQAKLVSWDSLSWKRVGERKIGRDPISAFNVSMDGKHLAAGTVEGDIIILSSLDMRVQMTVKKAHLGIVTTLAFTQDSRALVSTSFDSNARVTVIESQKSSGPNLWLFVLVIMLAVLVYYMRLKGVF